MNLLDFLDTQLRQGKITDSIPLSQKNKFWKGLKRYLVRAKESTG